MYKIKRPITIGAVLVVQVSIAEVNFAVKNTIKKAMENSNVFSVELNGNVNVMKDSPTSAYNKKWIKVHPKDPAIVAYSRVGHKSLNALLVLDGAYANKFTAPTVRARVGNDVYFTTTATVVSESATSRSLQLKDYRFLLEKFTEEAPLDLNFDATWEVLLPGGNENVAADWLTLQGQSLAHVYIVAGQLPQPWVHRTVLAVGTLGAISAENPTNLESVTRGVMTLFSSRALYSATSGKLLKYYRNWEVVGATKVPNTYNLINTADGPCQSWTKFFIDVLRNQGITVPADSPYVLQSKTAGESILVAAWDNPVPRANGSDPPKSNQDPNTKDAYPYLNTFEGSFITVSNNPAQRWEYKWKQADLHHDPVNSLPGQGSFGNRFDPIFVPFSTFENHVLVQLRLNTRTVWFDPSYGQFFDQASEADFLTAFEKGVVHYLASFENAQNRFLVRDRSVQYDDLIRSTIVFIHPGGK